MEYSISGVLMDDVGEYDLKLEVNNIEGEDYRCDLISEFMMPAIEILVEYIETMPAKLDYKRDEDGNLSTKDMNNCIKEFNTNHLDKFLELLKSNIQSCGRCE